MENRQILYLGDIHGEFRKLMKRIEHLDMTDSVIIQVGDFGVGFHAFDVENEMLTGVNQFLLERNITLMAIRGNHDDPSYFADDPFKLSNIKLIPDYTILDIEGRKILCIGGALSIDRKDRIKFGWGYWEDEGFVFDKEALDTMDLSEVDTIVTHSSPNFCHPKYFNTIVYNYANQDAGLLRDLEIERDLITEFYWYVKPQMPKLKEYYYGHFHDYHIQVQDGVTFRLLDIDELY